MRAIVLDEGGRLAMRQAPDPQPGPGQVRVRTAACGVCATDLEMIDGDPRVRRPAILGHEWAGVVDAAGPGADASLVGRPCVAENVLADGGEVGFEHPGGYGEMLVTEAANVYPLPEGLEPAAAALIEPLAVAVRAVGRLAVAAGAGGRLAGAAGAGGATAGAASVGAAARGGAGRPEGGGGHALVFGDGPIGLLVLALLVRGGAERVVLVGGRSGRLDLARALGAAETVNYHAASDLVEAVRRAGGADVPRVVEASGSAAAMEAALRLAGAGGTVLVVGDYGPARAEFPWNRILHRELTLVGSNASAGAWPEAVRLASDGRLPLERLVSARMPAERFAEAVALVRSRRDDVVKVVLEWSPGWPRSG